MNRFYDTLPVLPKRIGPTEISMQEADDLIRASWPSRRCHGPCNQGRQPCATPAACEVGDDSDIDGLGAARGLVFTLIGSCAIVGVIALIVAVWL